MKKKGFTLIELIAVLVIMAILALIVTPLVMNIIRKARISADKRSIDAYGRSIELAIAGYLMDTGTFPTQISQLTIEYSGSEVVCSTTQLNSDSSVYLTGCTVAGRTVDYAYGKDTSPIVYDSYLLGDQVTYNNITYYVIEDSGENEENVKLLKSEPLTKAEMDGLNLEGVSINNDYISQTNYGLVQYGESNDYKVSTVKKIVDAWSNTAIKSGDNAKSRLITMDDLFSDLGYQEEQVCSSGNCSVSRSKTSNTPVWLYNGNCGYWLIGQLDDSSSVWHISSNGEINETNSSNKYLVRPVLELNKSADITLLSE